MNDPTHSLPGAPGHGGDLTGAAERFGVPAGGWLDLSTGINPFPYPDTEFDPELLRRLPTAGDLTAALSAARAHYGVPGGAGIIAVPGTQAALQALPHMRGHSSIAVLGPTYSEHAHTWRAGGHDVAETGELDALAGADVAVLVNPNNPDGRRIEPGRIMALAARGDAANWTIADEAFADPEPGLSVVGETGAGGLLVLRSMGKFFGLAGMRIGFVIGAPELTNDIAARLGPWTVGGAVLTIAARALADTGWIAETRRLLADKRAGLEAVLQGAGFTIIGGTDLFILAERADAGAVYDRLGRAGILARDFEDHPTWLRFGLPGHDGNLARLKSALSSL